jgi:EmrB/QacA subfamily drug resistance transporter
VKLAAGNREGTASPRAILAVLLLAGSSYSLSQTLLAPAIPAIVEDLGTTPEAASWLLTGFLLSAAVSTPVIGKLGDIHGKGRVLALVMAVFTVGGVICALSQTIGPMIFGRVLEGVSGGVYPLAYSIVKESFPREKVAAGLAMVSVLTGFGAAMGLLLAGVIIEYLGVSWLFWTSLTGIPAAIMALRVIPSIPAAVGTKIDWWGAGILSVGLGFALLGISRANEWGWVSAPTIGLLAGGVVVLFLFVLFENRQEHPIIEMRVLRQRTVAATNLATALVGFLIFIGFTLIPQLAHTPVSTGYGLGLSITAAGAVVAPLALVQLVVAPIIAKIGSRIGFRLVFISGIAFASASLLMLTLTHDYLWGLLISGALIGVGIAGAYSGSANLIVDAVPPGEVGVATGINTVARSVGGAFGTALATAVLLSATPSGAAFPTDDGYTLAFALAVGIGILALLVALLVPKRPSPESGATSASPRGRSKRTSLPPGSHRRPGPA